MKLLILMVVLVASACGSSTPAGTVSRTQFGDRWPLDVESGTLRCEGAGAIVFRAPDGTDYGVNGLAAEYEDIEPIWTDSFDGGKLDIGPLIDAGLDLCD